MTRPICCALLLLVGLMAPLAQAQETDSTMTRTLDPITVTAERAESPLFRSTGAVAVLEAREMRQRPARSLTDLLATMPGLVFLDVNGTGWDPQAATRGFYGGGEAEYVIVLRDGVPVNNLENGLVNWEQLVREPGARIEVLRGGASSLYGDAAIGAVINIRSDASITPSSRLELGAGSFGGRETRAFVSGSAWSAAADFSKTDGYRDHGGRTTASISARRTMTWGEKGEMTFSGSLNAREADIPGPIRSTDTGDRTQSLDFFRFDNLDEQTRRGANQGWRRAGAGRHNAQLSFESRSVNLVRTLPLASVFADTQERELDAMGYRASIQYTDLELPIGLANNLTIGADVYRGSLDSRYYQIALGDEATYRASQGGRQQLNNDGSAMRHALAGYAHLDIRPVEAVKLTAGARYDRIADSFDAVEGLSDDAADATNTAFSPKLGLNVRYMNSAQQVGNVWVSASRSFKAPTLDQLYDLRAFPVPFPPFEIRIASPLLTPQEGTAVEAGFYHLMDLASGWQGSVSLTGYTMDMENEIDFSFETFSNVNIGKSRHNGLETGLSFGKSGLGNVFANHTLQDVTQQSGDNKGNAVKAIPKQSISAGVSAEVGPLGATLVWKSASDMWVDDANTVAIDDYSTIDVRLSWEVYDWRFTADVFNLLDEDFDTTAYPDPGGSEVLFLFPSAMRTLRFGAHYTF
jgi:outer membrane cobalamin receptor